MQDKQKEIDFFDAHADSQEYNVFTEEANKKLVDNLESLTRPSANARLADLGCGSGVFTKLFADRGYFCVGLDLSQKLLQVGKERRSRSFVGRWGRRSPAVPVWRAWMLCC